MSNGQTDSEAKPTGDGTGSIRDEISSLDDGAGRWYDSKHNLFFISYLLLTIIMIIWPWIFFGVVWGLRGIQLHDSAAENNPKDTLYFVTAISNIIGLIVAHLFSKAVASLAQKRVVYRNMAIADVSFFTALKNRVPSFSLFRRGRRHLLLMVVAYLIIFALITPGITALLTPIHFTRRVSLQGKELDFSSNDTDCINWLNNYTPPGTCDWGTFHGLNYTNCLAENQLTDVLESGRGNILSLLPDNNVGITYTQLGAAGGLHFVGTVKGLLPIGPNGIPAFNTLDSHSTSLFPAMLHPTYNYTLDLQGISSNVTCAYKPESPVTSAVPLTDVWEFAGNCTPPEQDLFSGTTFVSLASNNSLAFWACLAEPTDSYNLYFRAYSDYKTEIGNITCTLSPIRPTIFPLTYTGQSDIFVAQTPIATSPSSSSEIGSPLVRSLGSIVWEAQTVTSNLLAETIITFGVKSFGLPPKVPNDGYLRLYEAMIQGIIDYEATYVRLLYSTQVNEQTPASCMRTVNGYADLDVFGWNSTSHNGGYLIPLTLVNLTTLVILVVAMCTGDSTKNLLPRFDPTDPESLILSHDASGGHLRAATTEPTNPTPWGALVAFGKNKDGIYRLWPKNEVVST